jgi:uncharacterized protein (TIGR03437 family)
VSAAVLLLAALVFSSCSWAEDSKDQAPSFSSDSIVNSANGSPASLTPNGLATVYGKNLAYFTAAVSLADVGAGTLPTRLGSVRVTVGIWIAPLLYVSPTQINFVIPVGLTAGQYKLTVEREGTSAQAEITLLETAPGLFVVDNGKLAATHADGKLITTESAAQPGEIIVVYGAGLGRTDPRQLDGVIPRVAASILRMDSLRILLDEHPLPAASILYAGITPGYPGLYQINIRLPETIGRKDPELRVVMADQMSQRSLILQVAAIEP